MPVGVTHDGRYAIEVTDVVGEEQTPAAAAKPAAAPAANGANAAKPAANANAPANANAAAAAGARRSAPPTPSTAAARLAATDKKPAGRA